MQKDNSTLTLKVALRRSLLLQVDNPVILETHGGFGHIFRQVYHAVPVGVVFEKDPAKSGVLAQQRPAWAVYEADCETAIAAGVVDDWPVNYIDLDPYGEPWPVIDALFSRRDRDWPARLAIVVNDGLRQKLKMAGGWNVGSMAAAAARFGNGALYRDYIEICRTMMEEKTAQTGYRLSRWAGYYCGHADQMTHYAAILTR